MTGTKVPGAVRTLPRTMGYPADEALLTALLDGTEAEAMARAVNRM